ncbi:hypothetical protein ILUMI_20210 [Ignelater luminosus]|uniref:Reverse transcriptase domain-containing protein n=1 Tax=Ignelater luminosus TaxID=2038154 RepID=A0A8K0CK59_IGNLU|nr:hypothetical protein ILUMI_20210 [Ignelater luminosus]
MILIHPDDRDFHRNLWRDDSSKPIQIYRLATVIYGTKPAVFLATRVLRKLAIEAEPNHPFASKVMNNDFHFADILTGSNSIKQAIVIRDQVTNILASGGFNLYKWTSKNSQLLIQNADESSIIDLDKNGGIKVYKIVAILIIERLQETMEKTVRDYQAGFRKGRLVINQIHALRRIQEMSKGI